MENQDPDRSAVAIATEKNVPRGSVEPVPTRQTGKEENHPASPTDDPGTEKRRAHYGTDPAFEIRSGESMPDARFDVNQVKTPNNPTKQDRINPGTEESGDGFYNHSMAA